ncbi:gamma-soluble NSF attachment protein-like [Gordionus sp. m RMFG-2023]|uniref:gamma-soluble NSF attachment protein-like n=1 Tax=Gordionus sp. m RMFG-2023 TaxID=3053472 RepID=UPI0031FD510C
MTSTSDSRILEGLKHIDKAEKYVKRSLFKWSADNDSAADEFNKAAISFQNAQAYEECKNAYIKAADCYLKINSQSAAARCYEHMAMIHKEIKEWNECYQAICKASDLFQQEGTTTTAILCLNKGGKMLERSPLPEKSADLYIKALEIVGSEEDSNQFSQLCAKVAQIYVRLNRYFDAVFYLTKQLDSDLKSNNFNEVGRCCLNLVLVQLTRGDSVSAENAMNQACSSLEFSGSAFCEVCLKLIRSYEENDGQGLKLLQTQNNTIKNLDTEYLILARNLKTPFEMEGSRGEDDNPSGGKRENSDDDLEKDTIDEERRRQELSKLNFAEQLQKRLSLHQNELPARKDSKGKRASASNERFFFFRKKY